MALCYFQVSHKSRSSYTKPASMQAQYITRDGVYAPTVDQSQYLTRAERYAMGKEDLVACGGTLPTWAGGDHTKFWEAAETYERGNARLCESWIVSLPRELSQEQNIALVKDVVAVTMQDRYPHTWAMHEVTAKDGLPQPHMHLMFSGRIMDSVDRSPEQFFRRYNAQHPEQGGAQKDPALWEREHVVLSRQRYSDMANVHLEYAGSTARIDPRTLEDRGFTGRKTEVHLGPRGREETAQYNATRREERTPQKGAEAAQAFQYWEQRKVTLGITQGMSHADAVQRIMTATRAPQPGAHLTTPDAATQAMKEAQERANKLRAGVLLAESGSTSPAVNAKINQIVNDEQRITRNRYQIELEHPGKEQARERTHDRGW